MFEEEAPAPEPCFPEDPRVKLLGGRVGQMLRVKTEIWDKFVAVEENQKLLTDFFETRAGLLFFSPSPVLTAYSEVSEARAAWKTLSLFMCSFLS